MFHILKRLILYIELYLLAIETNFAVFVSNFESKVLSIETLDPQKDILRHYYKQLVIDKYIVYI